MKSYVYQSVVIFYLLFFCRWLLHNRVGWLQNSSGEPEHEPLRGGRHGRDEVQAHEAARPGHPEGRQTRRPEPGGGHRSRSKGPVGMAVHCDGDCEAKASKCKFFSEYFSSTT